MCVYVGVCENIYICLLCVCVGVCVDMWMYVWICGCMCGYVGVCVDMWIYGSVHTGVASCLLLITLCLFRMRSLTNYECGIL